MLRRHEISDADWDRIKHLLPGQPGRHGGVAHDNRQFINAVLWIARTGSPWRDLPQEFGPWQTVWRMFDQWNAEGTLAEILHRLQAAFVAADAIDSQLWCIDGTTVRAARCAAGGGKKATPKSLATTP